MPSNLKPTTCKCMHLVMCGHFWSYYKDSIHTNGSATAENNVLHTNFMVLCFMELELLLIKLYIAGIGIFDLYVPVTLTR